MHLLRSGLVAVLATLATAAALRLLAPSLITPGAGFEAALVRGCAAVACGCALWGWLSVLAVVGEALRAAAGRPAARAPGVPAALRRLVLAGCGVALTAAAAPAFAGDGADAGRSLPAAVAGLPFPARAMDSPAHVEHVVVVRPGDSLWAITDRHSLPDATAAQLTRGWHGLYARNRAVIGDDPSLIHPGQRLTLPPDLEEPS